MLIILQSLLVGLALLLLSLWLWVQVTHRTLLKTASSIPSLKNTPFVGILYYTLFDSFTNVFLDSISDSVSRGVSTFCYWLGPIPFITLTSTEDLEKVLNSSSTFEKADQYKYLTKGLLNAPGEVWKTTRRQLNPLFRIQNLEQMMPVFNRNSQELVQVLSQHVDLGPVNVCCYTMDTALKTVCNLIYGPDVPIDLNSEEFVALKHSVERLPDLICSRFYKIWLWFDAVFNYFHSEELEDLKKKRLPFTHKKFSVLAQQKNCLDNDSSSALQVYENGSGPENLFDLQKKFPTFTERDIRSAIGTLYATGTDTVGLAVATALLVMAHHKDIQERLYEEISAVVGSNDEVTVQDLKQMTYLDQVYKETLRWSTIVPWIGRKTTNDIQLSTCKIPAGITVMVCLAGLHMNPKLYPDPKKFNPEHFTSTGKYNKEKYSFLPFSGGPRNCIGKLYSELLIKTQVVHLMRRFELTTTMDIYNLKKRMMVTLTCTEGYHISLQERNK